MKYIEKRYLKGGWERGSSGSGALHVTLKLLNFDFQML